MIHLEELFHQTIYVRVHWMNEKHWGMGYGAKVKRFATVSQKGHSQISKKKLLA